MGRGKTDMTKKIENSTNRQVTFSKRKKGLFKKAEELSVLCDAKVSIIMLSSSQKLSEYISKSTTTKEIFDKYQKTLGIDLWKTKYEKMQEELRMHKEGNNRLRGEISQRRGEDLSDLDILELRRLEQEMEASFKIIREQLIKKISSQTNTLKKKLKNYHAYQSSPEDNHDFEQKLGVYGIVDNGGQYESAITNGAANLYAFRFHHIHHPNLHYAAVFEPHHQFRLV